MYFSKNAHLHSLWIITVWLLQFNEIKCADLRKNVKNALGKSLQSQQCGFNQFSCHGGACISDDLQCDGVEDCVDGSDETTACKNVPCNPFYSYQCDYGACVPKRAKCNGIKECKDNSDEEDCLRIIPPHKKIYCPIKQFTCNTGECIPDKKLCDGHPDCPDSSDEVEDCIIFSCPNAFRCKYGACVSKDAKCNSIKECMDGSDEEGCPLKTTYIENKNCLVPKPPANGLFQDGTNRKTLKERDVILHSHTLITKCDEGFVTSTPKVPICHNGNFTSTSQKCERNCKQEGTKTTCKFSGSFKHKITIPPSALSNRNVIQVKVTPTK